MRLIGSIPQALPPDVRETLTSYVQDVIDLFGSALESVILYGSAAGTDYLPGRSNLNVLLIVAAHDAAMLGRYAAAHRRWRTEGIVVPLILTEKDIQETHDVFPQEYWEIKDRHVLLAGRDPFSTLHIDERHLRAQCAQDISANVMRLRQRMIEGGGSPEAAAILLPLSLTALLPSLRALFRLNGLAVPPSTDALLRDAASRLDIDTAVFVEAWNLKKGVVTPGPVELPRLFERYLLSLQALATYVNAADAEPLR